MGRLSNSKNMRKNPQLPSLAINFFYEGVHRLPAIENTRAWLDAVIAQHGRATGEINYIFCDDAYLYDVNKRYLNHDTYTDVISFDHTDDPQVVSGDIYISVERVKENAVTYHATFLQELARVMVHGILHFLGYKDHTPAAKQKMRQAEDNALRRLDNATRTPQPLMI